jgi:hypothetical protein|tara:strand:- start:214 stop:375 length:162 start_codon:yes stop_codon:yes gene_type:complete
MTLAEAKEKGLTALVKILEQDRDRREVLGMPKLEDVIEVDVVIKDIDRDEDWD